jgi:transposase-like protein
MNKLSVDKKAAAVGMLCEGSSIRAIERITGIHRDTIMRLGVRMGEGCQNIMDKMMQNLSCRFNSG